MGDQPLYSYTLKTSQNGTTSDTAVGHLRRPHGQDVPLRARHQGLRRLALVLGQRQAVRLPRRRHDGFGHVPALLQDAPGQRGQPHQGDGPQRPAARGRRPAGLLLRRDGQAGPARLRRLPLLQLLGGRQQLDRQGPGRQLPDRADPRPPAAQPPERHLLQLERQHPDRGAGAGRHPRHEGRRLRHPADGLGGVQVDLHARPVGHEGGAVQLVPAELRVQPELLGQLRREQRAPAARSSTAAAPGASRPRPAPARRSRRWTRSTASCRTTRSSR